MSAFRPLEEESVGSERTLARVCREAGANVRFNVELRDLYVVVPTDDGRSMEVLASGLPMHHVAVDTTLRSATFAEGLPQPNAAHTNGAVLIRARTDKQTKYAELVAGNLFFFLVIALETGGRWSTEAVELVDMMAGARAREVLQILPRSVHLAWGRRWTRMLFHWESVLIGLVVAIHRQWVVNFRNCVLDVRCWSFLSDQGPITLQHQIFVVRIWECFWSFMDPLF